MTNTNNGESFPNLARIRNNTKQTNKRMDINQSLIGMQQKYFREKNFNPIFQIHKATVN
jgi:hypothetical protein